VSLCFPKYARYLVGGCYPSLPGLCLRGYVSTFRCPAVIGSPQSLVLVEKKYPDTPRRVVVLAQAEWGHRRGLLSKQLPTHDDAEVLTPGSRVLRWVSIWGRRVPGDKHNHSRTFIAHSSQVRISEESEELRTHSTNGRNARLRPGDSLSEISARVTRGLTLRALFFRLWLVQNL
jgi:hypothetical protein